MIKVNNYHDLQLKRDDLLLADVFEEIRKNSLKTYGLCPSYLGPSALSWDTMLDITKVKLGLI